MKRILFCATILALVASCTQDEFETNSAQGGQQLKGITFTSVTPDTPTTKGDLNLNDDGGSFSYFWYAEQDRINIWSTWAENNDATKGSGSDDWNLGDGAYATYKATQSSAQGKFTGIDDSNILDFVNTTNTSNFFAAYPGAKGSETGVKVVGQNADGAFVLAGLPSLKNQTQTNKNSAVEMSAKQLMYSYSTGKKVNSYDAVGENINLRFTRPFTAALFQTVGADEYKSIFGNWTKVTLEMKGYDADPADNKEVGEDDNDIKPSLIDYGTVNYAVMPDETYTDVANSSYYAATTPSGTDYAKIEDWSKIADASSKMELAISGTASINWASSDYAYMAMNRVNRDKEYSEDKPETYTITYSFEYIDLSDTRTTYRSWPSKAGNNAFVSMPLDMKKYPYLVTKDRTTDNTRALIVLSGDFDDIYADAAKTKVKWQEIDAVSGAMKPVEVALSEFTTIQSKVELTEEELAGLKNFTALHDIKLDVNTEIPAGTFSQTTLKEINFPMVTTIESKAFANGVNLETVLLPSYDFAANEAIALEILKKDYLKVLDMSAVEEMAIGFPSTGFTLNGYTELKEVTVNPVELVAGSNAFNGCIALTTVKGQVKLDGTAAFKNTAISKINITNTNIPVSAFEGCENLEDVLNGGAQVVPTRVGQAAFKGCSSLVYMDLSQVANNAESNLPAIGKEAFRTCSNFVGSDINGKKVLYVGGQTMGEFAFAGCTSLKHVEFLEATQLGDNIFFNCELTQIQFDAVFDTNYTTYSANAFGKNTQNVDVFVTEGQEGWDDNTLYMNGNSFKFKSVQIR